MEFRKTERSPELFLDGLKFRSRINRALAASLLSLTLVGTASIAHGQGTLTLLQTGGGQPLVSDQIVLQGGNQTSPVIQIEFGFATDEVPSPNAFLDSFTVSIEDANGNLVVVSTTDASGTDWEPESPGAVTLPPSDVLFQSVLPDQASPINGQGVAYLVDVTPPAQFLDTSFTVDLDLFDDMDPNTSAAAYFNNVQLVSVPEPSSLFLAMLPLAFFALKRKLGR